MKPFSPHLISFRSPIRPQQINDCVPCLTGDWSPCQLTPPTRGVDELLFMIGYHQNRHLHGQLIQVGRGHDDDNKSSQGLSLSSHGDNSNSSRFSSEGDCRTDLIVSVLNQTLVIVASISIIQFNHLIIFNPFALLWSATNREPRIAPDTLHRHALIQDKCRPAATSGLRRTRDEHRGTSVNNGRPESK